MKPNAYKKELGIRIDSYHSEKKLTFTVKTRNKKKKCIYPQQNNPIVLVKSFLASYDVFSDIHFHDPLSLVDDVQLMDHDS